jgi:hypothetical protein
MNWGEARTSLLAWAEALFLQHAIATWSWEPQPQAPARPVVLLEPVSDVPVMWEVPTTKTDDAGRTVTTTHTQQRIVTLALSMTNGTGRLDGSSFGLLGEAATRITLPSSVRSLREMGFGLVGALALGLQLESVRAHQRANPKATIEVRLAYVASATDAAVPFIERMTVTSELVNADGTPLTASTFTVEI